MIHVGVAKVADSGSAGLRWVLRFEISNRPTVMSMLLVHRPYLVQAARGCHIVDWGRGGWRMAERDVPSHCRKDAAGKRAELCCWGEAVRGPWSCKG